MLTAVLPCVIPQERFRNEMSELTVVHVERRSPDNSDTFKIPSEPQHGP
jgi:hypothetical protein